MKKILVSLLIAVCVSGMSGCGRDSTVLEPSEPLYSPTQDLTVTPPIEEKSITQQDAISMFTDCAGKDWVYFGCVLFPDGAAERIGAVLYRDTAKGTSNVEFFHADGSHSQCGVYAKTMALHILETVR